MHNKAMIADNQLAIVGGRNLGDEYFSASPTLQFRISTCSRPAR
jgi:putative cardiolipin synthase